MSYLQSIIMTANTNTPTLPGFLELLAINVLNLYRVLMVSRRDPIPLVQKLREELLSPQPGDIVVEVNAPEQPHGDRIGLLEAIIPKERGDLFVIQKLNGNYEAVAGRHFIKVPRQIITVQ